MPGTELTWGLLVDVLSKTAIVVAALYGTLLLLKRLSAGSSRRDWGQRIELVQSTHLGPGRSVHLLQVAGRWVLVGATSHQVSLLAELDVPDDAQEPTGRIAGTDFRGQVLGLMKAVGGARIRSGWPADSGRGGKTPQELLPPEQGG